MSIFSKKYDEDYEDEDEGSILGKADRYEKRKAAKERALEIHSGFASGLFERDEDVLEELRKLEED